MASSRGTEIPLILWICAAVCAHFVMGGGTEEVSRAVRHVRDDHRYFSSLGAKAREKARQSEQSFDVAIVDEGKPKAEEPEEKQPEPEKPKPVAEKKPEPKKPDPPKPEAKKPEPPPQEVKVVVKEDDPLKKLDQEQLKSDKRIAVRQHVQPNQTDNPNARFIGDQANKVEEESVATQTSHDEDDPNPTPGANKTAGPKDKVGDSERTKIAESEEHKGNKETAPGEKGTEFDINKDNKPIEQPQAKVAVTAPPAPEAPKAGGDGRAPSQIANKEVKPELAPGAQPAPAPEIVQAERGAAWFTPINPGQQKQADPIAGTTNQRKPTPQAPQNTQWLGLGGKPGPGQVNLNLSQTGVVAVVGADQLRKEREADGERRKSEHRGSWTASNFERWRNAIENYVSSVKPGNQTALNTAAVPFASYLNTIHNRIHPLFADSFLGSLDNLPKTHPLNSPRLVTHLEIVVSPKEGRIVKMGIVKTSGITAFDIAALDSVHRAQPFGPAPGAIVSTDGNVYLHWEFHRDEVFACSTMHARPFLLNIPQKGPDEAPQPPAPGPKSPTQERGAPPPVNLHEQREGKYGPSRSEPRASTTG
ncbi:MAG: TonB C-terminal domain-containing protein [Deltaproteobacteria bacterium]|nr:TonB C-terminal domain-containing protein [Deltaproteobacteria bacterium]